jgi:hypothetical protein
MASDPGSGLLLRATLDAWGWIADGEAVTAQEIERLYMALKWLDRKPWLPNEADYRIAAEYVNGSKSFVEVDRTTHP